MASSPANAARQEMTVQNIAEEQEMAIENIVLDVSIRDAESGLFLREQAASFDIVLRNETEGSVDAFSLELNDSTPILRVLHADGTPVGEYSPVSRRLRMVRNPKSRGSVKTVHLDRGKEQATWINLWKYVAPFPKGRYLLEVRHRIDSEGRVVHSKQVPFELVDTHLGDVALGYDSVGKTTSILAWTGSPADGGQPPQLLIRYSNMNDHTLAHQGGTPHGPVAKDSRLSVGQIPADLAEWPGWVAVTSGNSIELIRHNMSLPEWRSEKISLPISSPLPVPRFPDRGHAVYLGTGTGREGNAMLTGAKISRNGLDGQPWSVPLQFLPSHSACAFLTEGDISLLFVGEENYLSSISRLDVDEKGNVSSGEHVIRTTPNKVLAVTADMRPGIPFAFFVLEADRQKHDQLTLVQVPLMGDPEILALSPVEGWPQRAAVVGSVKESSSAEEAGLPQLPEADLQRLLPTVEVTMEVALDGTVWVAIVDESGRLYSGKCDGKQLALRRYGGDTFKVVFPHLAALGKKLFISSFTEAGALFSTGGL